MTKDTGKARLPGLVAPRVDNPDLARWVQAVAERLEVREGTRGNPYERAVTVRDLTEGGIAVLGGGGQLSGSGGSGGGGGGGGGGGWTNEDYNKFFEELKRSSLYRELMKRIDDPTRFDDMVEEVRAVLLTNIAEEARKRGAAIQNLETKIQSEARSLAMAVQEVTAAVQDNAAGVRFTQVAQADGDKALAAQVTQVRTEFGGKVAGVEQVIKAVGSAVEGLKAEYYVKVQANGAFGGFGLSAVSPADPSKPPYSQFLIAADKFAMVSPDGKKVPFAIDGFTNKILLTSDVVIDGDLLASGTLSVDKIRSGVNSNNSGYSFGFGAGASIYGFNGAGFFRSDVENTIGLGAVHTGRNVALAAAATHLGGMAALFGCGPVGSAVSGASIGTRRFAGFFYHRDGRPNSDSTDHNAGTISSAKLGTPAEAGYFICNTAWGRVETVISHRDGWALHSSGKGYFGGGLIVDGPLQAGGVQAGRGDFSAPLTVVANGVTTKIGTFESDDLTTEPGAEHTRKAYRGLWTSGEVLAKGGVAAIQSDLYATRKKVVGQNGAVTYQGGNVLIGGSVSQNMAVLSFTGAHFGVLCKTAQVQEGDILTDVRVVMRNHIADTLTELAVSTAPEQRSVVGVFAGASELVPFSLSVDGEGTQLDPKYEPLMQTHRIVTVNSVGEGQINVCGEGGDLELGDLIVTSSMPGKGMRQADDIVRSCTVAKVREPVKFSSPTEVKLVACIYLCG